MFLLKKLVTPLFLPLSISLELLLIGLILFWVAKKQKAEKGFLSLGFLVLVLISYDFFPRLALASPIVAVPPVYQSPIVSGNKSEVGAA